MCEAAIPWVSVLFSDALQLQRCRKRVLLSLFYKSNVLLFLWFYRNKISFELILSCFIIRKQSCCLENESSAVVLSFLGWTIEMLFWLDFHQTQSNLYKWFRMQRHNWSSTSPKEPMLHLSSSHCTGYQWQLASSSRHWCLHTERPQAQHPPTSTHYYESTSPPEVWDLLVSDALWYHHREAQNHSPEHSHSPFLDGGIIFPPLSGMLDPCQSSSNNWKLISFGTTWLHPKLVLKKKNLSLYLSLLPLLACTYLNNDWDLVLRALPLSDCLFKMNRFMYSPIVSRFG